MSDKTWWIVMGFWTLCSVWLVVWIYLTVKKSDDTMGIDWDRVFDDTCTEVARQRPAVKLHRVTELPNPIAPTWPTERREESAFELDDQPRLVS